jgi:hypothetical protein
MKRYLVTILLIFVVVLGGCTVVKEVTDDPTTLPTAIIALPFYVAFQAFAGVVAIDEAVTLSTSDFVEQNRCLSQYVATEQEIYEHAFVISEPVECRAMGKGIQFREDNIYFLKQGSAFGKNTPDSNEIKGVAHKCRRDREATTKNKFICQPMQDFVVETNSNYRKTGSSFRFKNLYNPSGHRDADFPWLYLYSYDKNCHKPLIKLPRHKEEILFGMFNDSSYPTFSGKACNFYLIRKIHRSSL